MGHVGNSDAVLRTLDLIDTEDQSGFWVFDIPVGVAYRGSAMKQDLGIAGRLAHAFLNSKLTAAARSTSLSRCSTPRPSVASIYHS